MPSEYYREVFGGEMSDACEFTSLDRANEILGLMMRHWNEIASVSEVNTPAAASWLSNQFTHIDLTRATGLESGKYSGAEPNG